MKRPPIFVAAAAMCACIVPGAEPGQVQGAVASEPRPGWVRVAEGKTVLGAPADESCRREEPLPQRSSGGGPLDVMATEVTQSAFEQMMGYNPSFNAGCPECPVDSVTFDEAALYCSRLAESSGQSPCYQCSPAGGQDGVRCREIDELKHCAAPRLPTANEFERVLRAGTKIGSYAGEIQNCMGRDEVADQIGWYKANSEGYTHEVATRKPNAWGLFDLAGNVAEWVHEELPREGDSALATLRGGSWYHNAHHLRSASRLRAPAERRLSFAGFRCVETVRGPRQSGVEPQLAEIPRPSLEMGGTPGAREAVLAASILYRGQATGELSALCGEDDNCAVEALVRQAASKGAGFVVTPEYALSQYEAELLPERGSIPGEEPAHATGSLVGRFSRLADELDIFLVINLITEGSDGEERNSVLAFDRDGRVVGRHHKFELYGSEREELTPGSAVTVFETPFGRVGLLVCADIYGQPAMHRELMNDLDARIIAWSAAWTVEGATRWQSTFARDWNVYFVAANGAKGLGGGGGVFNPDGEAIGTMDFDASIVYAEIPR